MQPRPDSKGQVWGCHLLTAGTSDGTPFEIMPIVDEQSNECLATLVERSIGAQDVTDRLFDLFVLRGAPECIRSHNGAGSMAKAIDDWLRLAGVGTHSIKGKAPRDKGAGSFSRKLKDELIEKTTFTTLPEARAAIEGWRELHNETLLRLRIISEEPCQSPRLQQSTTDGSHSGWTPPRDSPVSQLEPCEAPGLPGSTRRGAGVRQPVSSDYSPAEENEALQPIPQHGSPAGEPEPYEAPGLPSPIRPAAEARRSVRSDDSRGRETEAVRSIPQHGSPVREPEPQQAAGLPSPIRPAAEARQSARSNDPRAKEAGVVRSIPQRGSPVGEPEPQQAAGLPASIRRGAEARRPVSSSDFSAEETRAVQSVPQHDSTDDGPETYVDQGLPRSLRHGIEAGRSIPSLYFVSHKANARIKMCCVVLASEGSEMEFPIEVKDAIEELGTSLDVDLYVVPRNAFSHRCATALGRWQRKLHRIVAR